MPRTPVRVAAGAAIVFWLASGLSRSLVAGALAALLVIVISPRLYSYPKIIVFAVALLVVWWYARRPSVRRAVALAAVTVCALLMRHDFGVRRRGVGGHAVDGPSDQLDSDRGQQGVADLRRPLHLPGPNMGWPTVFRVTNRAGRRRQAAGYP